MLETRGNFVIRGGGFDFVSYEIDPPLIVALQVYIQSISGFRRAVKLMRRKMGSTDSVLRPPRTPRNPAPLL